MDNENKCTNVKNTFMVVTYMFARKMSLIGGRLDVLGIKEPKEKKSQLDAEIATMEHFLNTVSVNNERRYELNLL